MGGAEAEAAAMIAGADWTLVEHLCDLTKRWNIHEDIPRSQQIECREIGKRLNEAGGFALMQDAYREARSRNRAVSVVQAYWDGVGDWRW